MELYTYYRSSSAYRLRIALALKGLDYTALPVNLIAPQGGEHKQPAYLAVNPQGRVPALRTDEGDLLTQSPAIIEYLEERYPQVPLLSSDLLTRARERAVAALVGCDIQPMHNSGTTQLLRERGFDDAQVLSWVQHWIARGLNSVEQMIGDEGYCFGPTPGVADVYLVAQLYAADRFGVSLEACPRIRRVGALAAQDARFLKAHPDNQPDKPAS